MILLNLMKMICSLTIFFFFWSQLFTTISSDTTLPNQQQQNQQQQNQQQQQQSQAPKQQTPQKEQLIGSPKRRRNDMDVAHRQASSSSSTAHLWREYNESRQLAERESLRAEYERQSAATPRDFAAPDESAVHNIEYTTSQLDKASENSLLSMFWNKK